jgi:Flp pilus assembly protein TadB
VCGTALGRYGSRVYLCVVLPIAVETRAILALYIVFLFVIFKISTQGPAAFKRNARSSTSAAQALTSGETLAQAIEYVGSHGIGLCPMLFLALRCLRCGDSTREALEQLSVELDAPRVGLLVTALLISQRTGSPVARIVKNSAETAERQGEMERLLAVKTAQVRLSFASCACSSRYGGNTFHDFPGFPGWCTYPCGRRMCRGCIRHGWVLPCLLCDVS